MRRLIHFRHAHPVFRRRRWFQGESIHAPGQDDIAWFDPAGEQASEQLWQEGVIHSLGIFINGENFPNPNARGEPVTDDSFYLIFNAHFEDVDFILPPKRWGLRWLKVFDTAQGWMEDGAALEAGAALSVVARSFVLLQRQA
jgi:glycogen operon protein